jgi:DUF4097 and DUF4098 domain-containing protein YvlB
MSSAAQVPPPMAPVPPGPPRPPRSLAGPVVLILLGFIFLMGTMGVLHWRMLGVWFARYWPILIILWGLIKLVEYQRAQRQGARAPGIGVGGIFLLILLVTFGLIATQASHFNWGELRDRMDIEDGGTPIFGHTYNYEDQLARSFPAGSSLHILDDRGAVNVTTSQDGQIHVTVHKRINAETQDEADRWNSDTKPQITPTGGTLTLNANTHGGGDHWVASDIDVAMPRKASVVISTRRGDASVLGRDGDIDITNQHGNTSVTDVNGTVSLHLDHSSARVAQVSSDVAVDGRANDVSIQEVKGQVRLNGDFTESLRLSKISKGVSFKTARTKMDFARIDGDLDLDSGDLQADNVTGPLRLETRSKDIRLGAVSGDVHLVNENGAIEIRMNKLGNMQVENRQGDIAIYVPDKAGFQVNAHVRNGDIESDFDELKTNDEHDEATAVGTVGAGGPLLTLNNVHGTIEIRKASSDREGDAPRAPKPPSPPRTPTPRIPQETEN